MFRNRIKGLAVSQPNVVWVGDLTYVRTAMGFLFLALLTDKVSRKVVGYHCGDALAAGGCLAALKNALAERVNGILKSEYGLGGQFKTKAAAHLAIDQAAHLYNTRRPHTALGYRTPQEAHSLAA